jgi:hypothetical protein
VDALSREALSELWYFFSKRVPLPPTIATIAIPGSWPLPGMVFGVNTVAKLSPEDYKSLDLIRRLWLLVEPHLTHPSSAKGMLTRAITNSLKVHTVLLVTYIFVILIFLFSVFVVSVKSMEYEMIATGFCTWLAL